MQQFFKNFRSFCIGIKGKTALPCHIRGAGDRGVGVVKQERGAGRRPPLIDPAGFLMPLKRLFREAFIEQV
jgi:hypothetical protein